MTTRTVNITLCGGAFNRHLLELSVDTVDVTPDDVWPPNLIQLDGYEARWTYARVPGERTADGDHVFQFTHRETGEMIRGFRAPDHDAVPAQVRRRS